jgi:cell division protein FtsB
MKLNVLIICLGLFVSSLATAQSVDSTKKRVELIKVESIQTEEEIAALKQNVKQIEAKISAIKNDPKLLEEAERQGYLIELMKMREASLNKIKSLQITN